MVCRLDSGKGKKSTPMEVILFVNRWNHTRLSFNYFNLHAT